MSRICTYFVNFILYLEENTSNCEALREKVTELETNSIELNNQLKKLNEKKRKMDIQ